MLVPYSKNHVVGRLLASTVPFSVADVGETLVAAAVTTPGGAGVAKMPSAPRLVPVLFVATTR